MAGFRYFDLKDVLRLHELSLEEFGGAAGLRDQGLLESALAMPQASFGGQEFHSTLEAKAAAYLFHISQAHAFIDGNKRTAMACALGFIRLNGRDFKATDKKLIEIGLGVAAGQITKEELTTRIGAILLPESL
jgi:death on curing protein